MIKNSIISYINKINTNFGSAAWENQEYLSASLTQKIVSESIHRQLPLLSGKIGSNEQMLVHWHSRIPIGKGLLSFFIPMFFNTNSCLSNAGAFPRSRESYHQIGDLFERAINNTDVLTVFGLSGERQIQKRLAPSCLITKNLSALPYHHENPWSRALEGKRVLVVSPFADTIEQQYRVRDEIWPADRRLPEMELIVKRFPYLIDREEGTHWKVVYDEFSEMIVSTDFDVALMGCGFMGLLFGDLCKSKGKVGIHMGGALQVLFGITGKRYEQQAWFSKFINNAWTRPLPHEVPKVAKKIEDGCYW